MKVKIIHYEKNLLNVRICLNILCVCLIQHWQQYCERGMSVQQMNFTGSWIIMVREKMSEFMVVGR